MSCIYNYRCKSYLNINSIAMTTYVVIILIKWNIYHWYWTKHLKYTQIYNIYLTFIGRQHRKDIDLNLKPFTGNNNINNYIFHTKKNVEFKTSNKYLLLLLYYEWMNKISL